MGKQNDTISQYLALTKKIQALEQTLTEKESELRRKYTADFSQIKKSLSGYMTKIRPTVEMVCDLYRLKVRFSGERIHTQEGVPTMDYDACTACEEAIRLGNEGIQLLSAVIQKNNVDVALREFAVRYNTVAEIHDNADLLITEATRRGVDACGQERIQLEAKRQSLCANDQEHRALTEAIQQCGEQLTQACILNERKEIQREFVSRITLPLGYESCDNRALGIRTEGCTVVSLLEWTPQEDNLMVIRADRQDIDSPELSTCAVNAVIQFLFAYPAASKKILLCDSRASDRITAFAGILKSTNTELFFDHANGSYVKNSDEEIRISLSEVNRTINQRIMTLSQSGYPDVLKYNRENQDNPMPILMVLLNGYPFGYENAAGDLANILKNGKNAGVCFLITENTHDDEDSRYYRKRLPQLDTITKNVADFRLTGDTGYLYKGDQIYCTNTCGERYNLSALLSAFKVSTRNETDSILYLDNVVDREDFTNSPRRKAYSKNLSIPFGKQGSNPVSIDLRADSTDAHLAIIGTTGSGKTAFLNSLILSACKLYAPSELELHLIVMVKGDFKIFEEQGLPHLKTVVTGDRIYAANDVLDFIDEEIKRRGEMIGSYGNIYAYNASAAQPLPRCMIIIDEFYQLVQGSDDAIDRINRIAQVGRAYGISLVVSSIRFPMEVNSIIPLFGNRIEFMSEENAGQLIPQAAGRQNQLEGTKGSCFFSNSANLNSVRVAYAGEGERLKQHILAIQTKYPHQKMVLRSRIEAVRIGDERDVPFTLRRAKDHYDDEGVIRTRLGKVYLSDRALEYPFDAKNNLLFLFGHYLDTKLMEASLIKDTLVLSRDVEEPTVYYVDYNKNATLRRAKTAIRRLRDKWVLSGKMVYSSSDEAENTFEELRQLIQNREDDDESALYPILVVIAKADELFADDDLCETLCALISRGKENNVYFAIQCNEPVRFYGCDKYLQDAIIFPDRYSEGETYASDGLCAALEAMPAGATDRGRKLIANASRSPLDPRLHILCDNNQISLFVPYEYDEEYLKNIVE